MGVELLGDDSWWGCGERQGGQVLTSLRALYVLKGFQLGLMCSCPPLWQVETVDHFEISVARVDLKLQLTDTHSVPGITKIFAAVFSQILLDGALGIVWVSISKQILGGLVKNSPRYRSRSVEVRYIGGL